MKRLIILMLFVVGMFTLAACGNGTEDPTPTPTPTPTPVDDRPSDAMITLLKFPHLDGYGNEVMRDLPILFEFELRDRVRYQVAFVSCTCRAPQVNYWSVAYFEIDKNTGELLKLTFSDDGTGNYTAGFWGDSDPIPGTGKTYRDHFKVDFIPWLVGQTLDDLDGINIFYNDPPPQYIEHANTKLIDETDLIDAYTGSSVTTHTLIRVTKALLEYHQENYID